MAFLFPKRKEKNELKDLHIIFLKTFIEDA